jgi:hypothetical protein
MNTDIAKKIRPSDPAATTEPSGAAGEYAFGSTDFKL